MSKSDLKEFRDDVARVREPGVPIGKIATGLGHYPMTLTKWMRRADIDDDNRPGQSRT